MTSGGATDTPLANAGPVGESVQTPYRRFLEDFCENKIAVISFVVVVVVTRVDPKSLTAGSFCVMNVVLSLMMSSAVIGDDFSPLPIM